MERYSIYETKAKLSAILRLVKQRKMVCITERGEDVAWILPSQDSQHSSGSLEERLDAFARANLLQSRTPGKRAPLRVVAKRPGALQRFLADREDDG